MNNVNYSKQLDELMVKNKALGIKPRLMLHVCCAVCASYVLEYLVENFEIYIVYYNPNITKSEEYQYRYSELKRLIKETGVEGKVKIVECDYSPERFLSIVKGHENDKEGGARCSLCFGERLKYTFKKCEEYNCDYFATTLTISPLKNAKLLNEIGSSISDKYLPTDFKKKEGYKRSIELSKKYNLYRQNYCGCEFSKPIDKLD